MLAAQTFGERQDVGRAGLHDGHLEVAVRRLREAVHVGLARWVAPHDTVAVDLVRAALVGVVERVRRLLLPAVRRRRCSVISYTPWFSSMSAALRDAGVAQLLVGDPEAVHAVELARCARRAGLPQPRRRAVGTLSLSARIASMMLRGLLVALELGGHRRRGPLERGELPVAREDDPASVRAERPAASASSGLSAIAHSRVSAAASASTSRCASSRRVVRLVAITSELTFG